jgi:hypothetical protein
LNPYRQAEKILSGSSGEDFHSVDKVPPADQNCSFMKKAMHLLYFRIFRDSKGMYPFGGVWGSAPF